METYIPKSIPGFKTIGIKEFQETATSAMFLNDDFVMLDHLSGLPGSGDSIQLNVMMFVFCLEGKLQVEVNGRSYTIQAGDVQILPPRMVIENSMTSPDLKIRIVGYSPNIIPLLVDVRQDTWDSLNTLYQDPILHFDKEIMQTRLFPVLEMLRSKCEMTQFKYREDLIFHIFAALFFEILSEAAQRQNDKKKEYGLVTRADYIFRDFINALHADGGMNRTVSFYADKLCLSPKYLYKVIRHVTGRNPLEIINENAVEMIRRDLKQTDLSIKEIAAKYNFSNFSFFCRFVKTHIGMTPQAFRSHLDSM